MVQTGLAQCAELTWRPTIDSYKTWVVVQHSLGLMNVYKRADGMTNAEVSNDGAEANL